MQDRETDSYWAIMTSEAIAGKMKGARLKELPVSEKMQWKDWLKKHPKTMALSVNGREDVPFNPYTDYFRSEQGFRGTRAKDKRLKTKEPIFAFHLEGQSYAAPHSAFEGGKNFDLGSVKLFLYRPPKANIFYSTVAYVSSGAGFKHENGNWYHIESGRRFDPESGLFEKGEATEPQRFHGFDTFWYNWSLSNPNTRVLQ